MKTGFVFPGQGAQRVGMAADLYAEYPAARELFDRADDHLGWSVSRLCFEGPEDDLGQTQNTQPALFVASLSANAALRADGWTPCAVAGHSLGEYAALVAAGAISFEDGLELVRVRGGLMSEIGVQTPGGMAAVLGLGADEVTAACEEAAVDGVVEVANYNSPDQTVISGSYDAVQHASNLMKERGASRVIALNVSAPFHCSLMAAAVAPMQSALDRVRIRTPDVPVVANVTARPVTTPDEIRAALIRQLAGSVRWTETVTCLVELGAQQLLEVGPGRVLTALAGRISPDVPAYSAGDCRRIAEIRQYRTPA